jgi:glutamate racemase
MLPEGFDNDLEGKEEEKEYTLDLKAKEAFGKRNPQMIRMIPTKMFHAQKINPAKGMQLSLDGQMVKIISVSSGRTLVDFNNPLAGKDIIYEYTKEAVDFLFAQGATLIVLACNSASSGALRRIQQEYLLKAYPDRKVLGVIRPLAELVANDLDTKRIGVIGTKATINSHVYDIEIKKIDKNKEVIEKSASLLVPLIEEGWIKSREARMILKKYLRPLKEKQVDSLILGCTHYPFLFSEIRNIMPKKCKIYNPGEIVAESLIKYIERHKELNFKKSKNFQHKIYTSGQAGDFANFAKQFLGIENLEIKKVNLGCKINI